MEIGGTTLGTQYDHITASGSLGVGGALKVSLINGFVPAAGQSFDLLDFGTGSLSGTFSSIVLPTLAAGLQWNASQLYATGAISVNLLGDYNGNGVVDAADYVVYRATLGTSGTALAADGNGNGVIDAGDYDVFRSSFGHQAGSGAGVSGAAVPEPAAVWLIAMGVVAIVGGGWRKGR
jgi:hypothetical protein